MWEIRYNDTFNVDPSSTTLSQHERPILVKQFGRSVTFLVVMFKKYLQNWFAVAKNPVHLGSWIYSWKDYHWKAKMINVPDTKHSVDSRTNCGIEPRPRVIQPVISRFTQTGTYFGTDRYLVECEMKDILSYPVEQCHWHQNKQENFAQCWLKVGSASRALSQG